MRLVEVKTIDDKTIMVNPSTIATIEPSSRPYQAEETDLHFLQRKITIKMPYERAVKALSEMTSEQQRALEAALHEASVYGIGATSDTNQKVILDAARAALNTHLALMSRKGMRRDLGYS